MQVIAIRRGKGWIYDPDKTTRIEVGDILISRGPEAGADILSMMAGRWVDSLRTSPRRVTISTGCPVDHRDEEPRSYLSGLHSCSSITGDSRRVVASTKRWIICDDMDLWVLEAARKIDDVRYLRASVYVLVCQAISDSAHSIVDVLLRDIEIPPVFKKIVRESDEIITRIPVAEPSPLIGRTLKEASLGTVTGMVVLAIKHGDRWVYRPGKGARLQSGDIIIAKGRRDGECRLYELAGYTVEEPEE